MGATRRRDDSLMIGEAMPIPDAATIGNPRLVAALLVGIDLRPTLFTGTRAFAGSLQMPTRMTVGWDIDGAVCRTSGCRKP